MSTWILGVSALYHDAAAVLLRDGVIVAAAQEERFSRVKHDASLPVRATKWCLEQGGISIGDLDHLVFYEKPLRKFERILANSVATFPRSWRAFPRQMVTWLGSKLWVRNQLVATFAIQPHKLLFSEHHLSHAASAFLCSPYDEATILTVDGVGEEATTGLWRGTAEAPFIEPLAEVRFPHSLGMFYSTITALLGFAVNSGEYKVMGMAAYGEPRFRDEMDKLLRLEDGGAFSLDLDYFSFHYHPTQSYRPRLVDLLGEPRMPGEPFRPTAIAGDASAEAVARNQRFADIAASAQAAIEDALLHVVRAAHAEHGGDTLCMAGGVALNSVANHRLAKEGPYDKLWIQPAAGDAGGALGAALWAWHCVLGKPRTATLDRIDLGRSWTRDQTRQILDDLGITYEDLGDTSASTERAAADLAEGDIIGWFDGRFEWGPRALGHRSILADPRGADTKDKVNARIKFRESFRPFAPAITEEAADDWYDIAPAARVPLRFMLATPTLKPEREGSLPATTHLDGTSRVQIVRRADHPHFHELIGAFSGHSDTPVLLNTSFNLKGDPIVTSPIDALATLRRSELDTLYMDGFRVPSPD